MSSTQAIQATHPYHPRLPPGDAEAFPRPQPARPMPDCRRVVRQVPHRRTHALVPPRPARRLEVQRHEFDRRRVGAQGGQSSGEGRGEDGLVALVLEQRDQHGSAVVGRVKQGEVAADSGSRQSHGTHQFGLGVDLLGGESGA
eukprot:scaffold5188_cov101-Isochrysis_galbana.AAC.2